MPILSILSILIVTYLLAVCALHRLCSHVCVRWLNVGALIFTFFVRGRTFALLAFSIIFVIASHEKSTVCTHTCTDISNYILHVKVITLSSYLTLLKSNFLHFYIVCPSLGHVYPKTRSLCKKLFQIVWNFLVHSVKN